MQKKNKEAFMILSVGGQKEKKSILKKMLKNSIAIGVWEENELVGFARVVSDGVFRAYIEDVVVHESVRNKGIERRCLQYYFEKYLIFILLVYFAERS